MLLVHQQFGSFSQEHMVFKRDYMKKFQGAVKTFLFHKYRNELNWQSVYVVIEYKLLKSKQKSCWLPRTACLCINSSNGCLSHSPSECNLHLGNVRPQVSQAHFLRSTNNGEMIRISENRGWPNYVFCMHLHIIVFIQKFSGQNQNFFTTRPWPAFGRRA